MFVDLDDEISDALLIVLADKARQRTCDRYI